MKQVVVIGGGFGGIEAARRLARLGQAAAVTVIDRKPALDFLPMLPDLLSHRIEVAHARYDLAELSRRYGFRFAQDEALSVDMAGRRVLARKEAFPYDYLVVAAGSQTDFGDNDKFRASALTLDTCEEAVAISTALRGTEVDTWIIVGGGYTGIEAATNIKRCCRKHSLKRQVIVVEKTGSLLGALPPDERAYAAENLSQLGIEVRLNCELAGFEGGHARLSDGAVLPRCGLVWVAGVRTPDFVHQLAVPKSRQGRISVDAHLEFAENCFAVGDAADVQMNGKSLRMGVQFSIAEGARAARNIGARLSGRPLEAYRPVDLGYVVPMANGKGCGRALGMRMRGRIPFILHYLMCVYRSYSWGMRLDILGHLLG